ncbi:MAG: hypothetical protein ABI954_00350 [Pyrinomonadaceae bacterium]
MLEIILLIGLTKKIGNMLNAKGRKSGWFKLLTVVLWIGGELIGAVIGAVIGEISDLGLVVAYPLALLGAAGGALTAYLIAKNVRPVETFEPPPPPPVFT